jgi:hypothetical protein
MAFVAVAFARRQAGRWRPSWPLAILIGRPPWVLSLTLVIFAVLGLVSGRGIAWWPLVAAVTVAALLETRASAPQRTGPGSGDATVSTPLRAKRRSRVNAVFGLALLLAAIVLLPVWKPIGSAGAPIGLLTEAPQGIAAELASGRVAGTNVWNPQLWGSWLELTVPAIKVATDSRIELFAPQIWDEADQLASATGAWRDILDRPDADVVITPAKPDGALDRALVSTPGWTLEYRDGDGSIWVRTTAP